MPVYWSAGWIFCYCSFYSRRNYLVISMRVFKGKSNQFQSNSVEFLTWSIYFSENICKLVAVEYLSGTRLFYISFISVTFGFTKLCKIKLRLRIQNSVRHSRKYILKLLIEFLRKKQPVSVSWSKVLFLYKWFNYFLNSGTSCKAFSESI